MNKDTFHRLVVMTILKYLVNFSENDLQFFKLTRNYKLQTNVEIKFNPSKAHNHFMCKVPINVF